MASRVDRSSSSTWCESLIHILLSCTMMYIIAQLITPQCEWLKMSTGLLLSVQTYIVACNRQHAIQTVIPLPQGSYISEYGVNTVMPMCANNHWIITSNLARSIQIDSWSGGPKSYLWKPVIASPVIQQTKMEEPQIAVSALLGLVSVAY